MHNISVVWDGAVDFQESYDANDETDRMKIKKSLIGRFGKIGEDFIGLSASELDEQLKERADDAGEESFL